MYTLSGPPAFQLIPLEIVAYTSAARSGLFPGHNRRPSACFLTAPHFLLAMILLLFRVFSRG